MLLDEEPARAARMHDGLRKGGFDPVCVHPDDSLLLGVERERPDVAYLALDHPDRALLDSLSVIKRHRPIPIILQTQERDPAYIRQALGAGVCHYLVGQLELAAITAAIDVALAQFAEGNMLRRRMEHACVELETHKRITRAKVLLMQRRRLDEPAAHKLLLQTAMERNLKLGEAAALVIRLFEACDEGAAS